MSLRTNTDHRAGILFRRYLPAQMWRWRVVQNDHADLVTDAFLASEKGHTKHARAAAQQHACTLQQQEGVKEAWVCDRGLIHVKFHGPWLLQLALDLYQCRQEDDMPERWLLDYGANLASTDVDWNSVRGAVVGDTIARTLQWLGHRVESEYTFDDTTRVNELLLSEIKNGVAALQKSPPAHVMLPVPALYSYLAQQAQKMDVRSDHAMMSFASDTMLARHKEQMQGLRIGFDTVSRWSLYGQRSKDVLLELQLAGATYEDQGCTWFNAVKYGSSSNVMLIDEKMRPTYFATILTQHAIKLSRHNDRTITLRSECDQYIKYLLNYGIEALMFDERARPELVLQGVVFQHVRFWHKHQESTVEKMLHMYGANAVRCAFLSHRRHRRMTLGSLNFSLSWNHLFAAHKKAKEVVPFLSDMIVDEVGAHSAVVLHLLGLKNAARLSVQELDPFHLYRHAAELARLIRRMPPSLEGAGLTVMVLAQDQLRQIFSMLGLDPSQAAAVPQEDEGQD